MAFQYTPALLESGLTYADYRNLIDLQLLSPPVEEAAQKMYPYIQKNSALMEKYDLTYKVSDELNNVMNDAPKTTWLVITEGWCGDAAFNLPMMAVIERAFPDKVQLKIFLRDGNLELMDANLTDGGRSIPKMVVLDQDLKVSGNWGPRPAGLHTLMKSWKEEGLQLKEIIPKAHQWYDDDETKSLQNELAELIKSYSPKI